MFRYLDSHIIDSSYPFYEIILTVGPITFKKQFTIKLLLVILRPCKLVNNTDSCQRNMVGLCPNISYLKGCN